MDGERRWREERKRWLGKAIDDEEDLVGACWSTVKDRTRQRGHTKKMEGIESKS